MGLEQREVRVELIALHAASAVVVSTIVKTLIGISAHAVVIFHPTATTMALCPFFQGGRSVDRFHDVLSARSP